MALETPRSPRGLHLLARHGPAFTSSLFLFISGTEQPQGPTSPTANSAQPAVVAGINPSKLQTEHVFPSAMAKSINQDVGVLQSQPVLQSDKQSLHQRLAAMSHQQRAHLHPDQAVTSSDAAPSIGALPQAQQPWHRSSCDQPAAVLAAAVATAHRCLESMLARDSIFALSPSQIAQALFSPALVFSSASGRLPFGQTSPRDISVLSDSQCKASLGSGLRIVGGPSASDEAQGGGLGWGLREGAGVYMGCCSLIMAGLRHRAGAVKRCMALVGASTRALLKALMLWSQPTSSR